MFLPSAMPNGRQCTHQIEGFVSSPYRFCNECKCKNGSMTTSTTTSTTTTTTTTTVIKYPFRMWTDLPFYLGYSKYLIQRIKMKYCTTNSSQYHEPYLEKSLKNCFLR